MTGRVEVRLTEDGDQQVVTCTYVSDGTLGTQARIYQDKNWLYFVTDDYEGAAMCHIEALPLVRRALAKIAHDRKTGKGKP